MTLPVGSIVASVLTLQDYRRLMPTTETWELADGARLAANALARLIQAGAEYAALNPNNVPTAPNLNGAFLRGRDYDTNPQNQRNPDGKTLVGTFQTDEFKSHSHGNERPNGIDAGRTGRGDGWYQVRSRTTDAAGGAETRPKNVTVNFFIRTN